MKTATDTGRLSGLVVILGLVLFERGLDVIRQ